MKRGQIKMSFGMIFSVILIIVFLAFGFYAIKTFLGMQSSATTNKFLEDLQSDIDRVWKSAQSSEQNKYFLPTKIQAVCFADFNIPVKPFTEKDLYDELKREFTHNENLVFYPRNIATPKSSVIENIAIGDITANENPYCILVSGGEISLTLEKDFGEARVRIIR